LPLPPLHSALTEWSTIPTLNIITILPIPLESLTIASYPPTIELPLYTLGPWCPSTSFAHLTPLLPLVSSPFLPSLLASSFQKCNFLSLSKQLLSPQNLL
jgi:hypothetical protein